MIGVIDPGGGLRGIYGAGVFDYCIEYKIKFDYGIGVSAGSANIASYIAGQYKRNFKFYTEYAAHKEYMGIGNLLKKRNFINLDYIYGTLSNSNGAYPLDFEKVKESDTEFIIVATDAVSGKPVYFTKKDMEQDDYGPIKCSSCVPIVNKPYRFRGGLYYDGGISDPIPIRKAFADGCEKIVLILTRPKDFRRDPKKDARWARFLKRKYPNAAARLAARAQVYNNAIDLAQEYEKKGKLLIVAPDSIEGTGMLKRNNSEASVKLYDKGLHDAVKIKNFLNLNNI